MRNHAIADALAGQAGRLRAAKNAEHVVLRSGQAVFLHQLFGILAQTLRSSEQGDEDHGFLRSGAAFFTFGKRHAAKYSRDNDYCQEEMFAGLQQLGFREWTQLHLAEKTLRALCSDHGHGVRNVLSGQHFAGILWAASGKFSGHAAWANRADADAEVPQILRHAPAETLQRPFRCAVDAASCERTFSRKRTDVDDVAGLALNHPGNDLARHE